MKIRLHTERKNSFLAVYFLLLTAAMLAGALAGCWLAVPMTQQMYAANVRVLGKMVQSSIGAVLPWLLSAVAFPAAIYLVSRLRFGLWLVGAVVWGKGLVFGYAFAMVMYLPQQNLLAVFLLRELVLLAILFWFCHATLPMAPAVSANSR